MFDIQPFRVHPKVAFQDRMATRGRIKIATYLLLVTASLMNTIWAQAQAQAPRTFVSGLGKDNFACTATAPCRTLQAALAKTGSGGQIYALDSADYGFVTINKGISIISGRGATGVAATSNTSGITINAGSNDVVSLQGLDIDGGGSGASGILLNSAGSLNIQRSVIRGFTVGINFQPNGSSVLSVANTLVANNTTGLNFQNSATGVLNDVQLINNGTGIVTLGVSDTDQANLTLQSGIVANNIAAGILAGSFSTVTIANTTIANNGVGVQAQSDSALVHVSGSSITGNGTGWSVASGGQVVSSSTNAIGGNISGNSAPPTVPAPSSPRNYLLDQSGGPLMAANGGMIFAP